MRITQLSKKKKTQFLDHHVLMLFLQRVNLLFLYGLENKNGPHVFLSITFS